MTRARPYARAPEATHTIAWGNPLAVVRETSTAWDASAARLAADHRAYRGRLDALHGSENGNG